MMLIQAGEKLSLMLILYSHLIWKLFLKLKESLQESQTSDSGEWLESSSSLLSVKFL